MSATPSPPVIKPQDRQEKAPAPRLTAPGTGPPPMASPEARLHRVAELAYAKWEAAGKPAGDGKEFWLEAERQTAGP